MEKERILIKDIKAVLEDGNIMATTNKNERAYITLTDEGAQLLFVGSSSRHVHFATATALYEGPVLLGFDVEV